MTSLAVGWPSLTLSLISITQIPGFVWGRHWNAPGRLAETTLLSGQWCKTSQRVGTVKAPAADALTNRGSGNTSWCKESLLWQYSSDLLPPSHLPKSLLSKHIVGQTSCFCWFLPLMSGGNKSIIVACNQLIPAMALLLNWYYISYASNFTTL